MKGIWFYSRTLTVRHGERGRKREIFCKSILKTSRFTIVNVCTNFSFRILAGTLCRIDRDLKKKKLLKPGEISVRRERKKRIIGQPCYVCIE